MHEMPRKRFKTE